MYSIVGISNPLWRGAETLLTVSDKAYFIRKMDGRKVDTVEYKADFHWSFLRTISLIVGWLPALAVRTAFRTYYNLSFRTPSDILPTFTKEFRSRIKEVDNPCLFRRLIKNDSPPQLAQVPHFFFKIPYFANYNFTSY